jgi:hypothetical protein
MNIFKAVTNEIQTMKTITEILMSSVSEANLDIIKNVDAGNTQVKKSADTDKKKDVIKPKKSDENTSKGQIRIFTKDANQVMITYIVLYGHAFKSFDLVPDKYSVGLNVDEFYKYIKNVDKEGELSMSILADNTHFINFKVENEERKSRVSSCQLRVLNVPNKKDKKIETEFTLGVIIDSKDFHKTCKDLQQYAQFVEITCDTTQLIITCAGDGSNHKREFKADGSKDAITIKHKKDKDTTEPVIIRLLFDLKYINMMYKCQDLCDDMVIYLKKDSVMFFKYGIKMDGEMYVGIAPSNKNKNMNYDASNESAYDTGAEDIKYKN